MAMDEATKQRLREAAKVARARKTLKGMERALGLVALDYVQEKYPADLPEYQIRNGRLRRRDRGVDNNQNERTWWTDVCGLRGRYAKGERGDGLYPWTGFKIPAPWQIDELCNRFPSRRVMVWRYQGPNRPQIARTMVVFPVAVVVEWYKFIWQTKYTEQLRKDTESFTQKMIHDFPGVGAVLRVTKVGSQSIPDQWSPLPGPGDYRVDGRNNRRIEVESLEQPSDIWKLPDDSEWEVIA